MNLDTSRVRAVIRKELREYRRTRFIVWTMAALPVLFLIVPLINVLTLSATASSSSVKGVVGAALLFVIIPVDVPTVIAAYSVVGERDQGTLEPLLTTPIRRTELLLGKGLAAIPSSVAVTYPARDLLHHRARRRDRSGCLGRLAGPAGPRRVAVRAAARRLGDLDWACDLRQIQRRPNPPVAEHARQPPRPRADHPVARRSMMHAGWPTCRSHTPAHAR
jgi:ABC-2 family transporter protein